MSEDDLEEEEGADEVGEPDEPGELDSAEERDPFKRRVAIVLALLGVLGAWVGILHNDSGNNESKFARETTRTAVGSLRANVNQSTVEGLGIDLDAEQEALGVAAEFETGVAGEGVDGSAAESEAEQGAESSAAQTEAAAGIDPDEREELERELTIEAQRLDLKRQALAETRVTYNNRTSQYETVLTTLAVALFLVGFTLVLGRRTRPPVLIPGLLLAAYVGGWALWIHQREVPTTPPAAIDAAAQAGMHADFGEFDQAVDLYTEAIDEDVDFVPAYTGRSIASFLAVNPDFTRTLAVVDTEGPEAQLALADVEEAIRLGEEGDFGSLVVSGIYRFYDEDYEGAVERLEAAVDVNDRAPEAFLLLTAAELAQGDPVAADEALERGVELLDLDEPGAANRQFAADLLTLLEQVEAAVPESASEVEAIRGRLVAGEARLVFGEEVSGEAPAGVEFSLDRSEFADGELDTELSYTGLPDGSLVSLYVYEQPAEGVAFAQSAELARFVTLEGSGSISGTVEIERACRPVAFRYDLYVDGGLVASFDAPGGEPTC
jgi:tetratricopeptide (TPR) repeat protein